MARKRPLLAISLALAAIAPVALGACGGSPATPTIGTAARPGAQAPITDTVPAEVPTETGYPTLPALPGDVPTMTGEAPPPVGTGVPAAVPTTKP